MGVIFEYDTVGVLTKKFDFDGTNNGRKPKGHLLQASNHKLYGMTELGGANDMGVIFEFDTTGSFINKIDFDGSNKGRFPSGSLMETSNGKIYGATNAGGILDFGVLFEYDTTAGYTKMLDFELAPNGIQPHGNLIKASNDKLYGMTKEGGDNSIGVLFEYDPITDVIAKKT